MEGIKEKFEKLIGLDKKYKIFGSFSHKYKINPKLSEEEILKFESENKITLPAEYREYLKTIGNGGAGPFYGLFPLGESDGGEVEFSKEFVYTRENSLNLYELLESDEFDVEDDEAYDAKWDEIYDKAFRGFLFIAHEGCGMYSILVVNGEEYGNMWYCDFANDAGLFPYTSPKTNGPMKFDEWLEIWLDKAIDCIETGAEELHGYGNFIV